MRCCCGSKQPIGLDGILWPEAEFDGDVLVGMSDTVGSMKRSNGSEWLGEVVAASCTVNEATLHRKNVTGWNFFLDTREIAD